MFTASAVPAAVGAAAAALRVLRSPDGPPLLARVLDNARLLRDGLQQRGFAVVAAQQMTLDAGVQAHAPGLLRAGTDAAGDAAAGAPRASIVTPIVPVLVGDDWKAALLWRALYDAGVFVNTALHPAVPPGGALLRTSVMATHDGPRWSARWISSPPSRPSSKPSTVRFPDRTSTPRPVLDRSPVRVPPALALVQIFTSRGPSKKGRF